MVKAILFDLDDTLYDEKTYVVSGFWAVAEELEVELQTPQGQLAEEMLAILEDDGRGRVFDVLLKRYGAYSKKRVKELVGVYRAHQPDITLFPDVFRVLGELQESNYLLGLVTNGLCVMQKRKVEALGIKPYMDAVVYPDKLGSDLWKPHPAGFWECLERLGVSSEHAMYVGNDPEKDLEPSRKIGMIPVQMCRSELGTSKSKEADTHVTDMDELARIL
jgi:putative hydrolase of the HAD superfamily